LPAEIAHSSRHYRWTTHTATPHTTTPLLHTVLPHGCTTQVGTFTAHTARRLTVWHTPHTVTTAPHHQLRARLRVTTPGSGYAAGVTHAPRSHGYRTHAPTHHSLAHTGLPQFPRWADLPFTWLTVLRSPVIWLLAAVVATRGYGTHVRLPLPDVYSVTDGRYTIRLVHVRDYYLRADYEFPDYLHWLPLPVPPLRYRFCLPA